MNFFEDLDKTFANINTFNPVYQVAKKAGEQAQKANEALEMYFDPTHPLVRLSKGINTRVQGAANLATKPATTTKQIVQSLPETGKNVVNFAQHPIKGTTEYFTNSTNDPLIPLDIALGAVGLADAAGAVSGLTKGAVKATPKTVAPQIPKTEIPIANTKPLPVQPKAVTPKTKIPTLDGDKYATAGRQQVFPTNPSKANPSMGGFESVKKQISPEEVPLSTEELFSMAESSPSTDIPLVKGLSDLMSGKEVNQNALRYMIDNEARARGISPQQLVDELTQNISIVDEMPFGQDNALGLHNRMTGKIYLKDVDKGFYTHPENPDYTITNWNNTLHEGMHRSINKIIEAHNNGTLTPEGYEYAKRIGINLDNPLTEDLSHVIDSLEIENPYISSSRVDAYNGRLNASEAERLRPIIRNDIADYIIKQDLSPINSDLNYYIQDAFNKAGIRYTPNIYVGNDVLGFN